MINQDLEEFLIRQDEFIAELNNTPQNWAIWQQQQLNYRQSLRINPLYVVSTSRKGNVRYCGGAEFKTEDEAIAFILNNPTKLGIQALSCLLP